MWCDSILGLEKYIQLSVSPSFHSSPFLCRSAPDGIPTAVGLIYLQLAGKQASLSVYQLHKSLKWPLAWVGFKLSLGPVTHLWCSERWGEACLPTPELRNEDSPLLSHWYIGCQRIVWLLVRRWRVPSMVVHACNCSTPEAEMRWLWAWGQPRLCSEF
jgi:hypothetical protein